MCLGDMPPIVYFPVKTFFYSEGFLIFMLGITSFGSSLLRSFNEITPRGSHRVKNRTLYTDKESVFVTGPLKQPEAHPPRGGVQIYVRIMAVSVKTSIEVRNLSI